MVRPELSPHRPVHVVIRACKDVGSLRTHAVFAAIREASIAVYKHEATFRIIHLSIQKSHVHLLVEASDRDALAMGMKAFAGSAAKHINALVSKANGARTRRRGSVFTDRYHAVALRSPKQVRNCLAYVLNNWRHHGADRDRLKRPWKIDPYATGLDFDGWKERENRRLFEKPSGYDGPLIAWPKTYLLREGWKRHGLISIFEVPGSDGD
jgi:REP element-mobilizing transposase RayT